MILWITKETAGTPNPQRVELIKFESPRSVVVRTCGDGRLLAVPVEAVCGFQIDPTCSIRFRQTCYSYYPQKGG